MMYKLLLKLDTTSRIQLRAFDFQQTKALMQVGHQIWSTGRGHGHALHSVPGVQFGWGTAMVVQSCQKLLGQLPGKTACHNCLARQPGKTAWQDFLARLPAKMLVITNAVKGGPQALALIAWHSSLVGLLGNAAGQPSPAVGLFLLGLNMATVPCANVQSGHMTDRQTDICKICIYALILLSRPHALFLSS